MGRRAALLVLVLALLGGGALVLRGALRSGSGARSNAIAREADEREEAALAPASSADAKGTERVPGENRSVALASDGAPGEPGSIDLEHATWIEGRVAAPLGSPRDDSLAVIAIPRPEGGTDQDPPAWWNSAIGAAEGWTRTPVAPDGRFRAPVPEGTRRALVYLDGRFLYLARPLDADCGADARELLLEPELGGCIALRCVPPPQAPDGAQTLAGTEVELTGAPAGRGFFAFGGRGGQRREYELPAELALELRGLDPDLRYALGASPDEFASLQLFDLAVEPGRVTERELAFAMGARLSGQVVDGSGAPVAGAQVAVEFQNQFARFAGGRERSATSGEDGRFELRGVRPRKLNVVARAEGFREAKSELLSPRDADTIGGLRLALDHGGSIAGRVTYAGGAPAVGATLRLVSSADAGRGRAVEGSSRDEGRFELSGLDPNGTYEVYASAADPGLPAPEGNDAPAGWRAHAGAVAPGTRDLALELAQPGGLAGRVFGPEGEPLASFEVVATLSKSELARAAKRETKVEQGDGGFRIADAFEGEWKLDVEAPGLVTALEELSARVPQEGELRIDMQRAASVAGRVLDPNGAPVAGADVRASKGEARRTGFGPALDFGAPSAKSDGEGRFRIAELRPGSWRITASNEVYAPSPAQPLDLQPGAALQDLVLTLQRGGALTGEIYDASGSPDAARTIFANSMTAGVSRNAESDGAGRFAMDHLAPGQYMVMAQPSMQRLGELEAKDEELDPSDFMSAMKMTSVEIVEGETAHVVLGAPPKRPVRFFGRVTEAGEPVTGGQVMVVAEGRSLVDAWKVAKLSADGTYELVLDEPGDVLVSYQAKSFQESGVQRFASVPEVDEYRFDLELPTGRIEGVVVGPDGTPLAGQFVSIERETGPRGIATAGNGSPTDEAGRFRFEHLAPASYTLRATGAPFGDSGYGAATLSGVEVTEGGRVGGLRLELSRPGAIVGRVLASDGTPLAGASVFVRDGRGLAVSLFSTTTSDGEGRFRRGGLSPGEYTVSARADEAASQEVGPVRVREGEESDVEVRLDEGTVLRVSCEDEGGAPLRASVSVRDERGRELANLQSFAGMQEMFTKGFSTSEQRVGPLPPGTYEVVVTAADGRTEKRSVKLTGKAERKLRLRFSS